ncbi:MAG: hypothetical protein RL417_1697 [Pseudomonadota bacterium]
MTKDSEIALQRGVSLAEVLIGIAIAALLGMVSSSSLDSLRSGVELRHESDSLVSALQQLQAKALESGHRWYLVLEEAGWSIAPEVSSTEPQERLSHRYEGGVRGVVRDGMTERLLFFPSGTVSPRTVTLERGRRTARLTVALRGRVTVVFE